MNVLTWDLVTWMSIAMVVIAIAIFVYLGFKVMKLMNQDAEKHKSEQ
jgi:flagellar biogenesis protein FliO